MYMHFYICFAAILNQNSKLQYILWPVMELGDNVLEFVRYIFFVLDSVLSSKL